MNEEKLTDKILKLEKSNKFLINRTERLSNKINKMSKQIEHLKKENELFKKKINHLEILSGSSWN